MTSDSGVEHPAEAWTFTATTRRPARPTLVEPRRTIGPWGFSALPNDRLDTQSAPNTASRQGRRRSDVEIRNYLRTKQAAGLMSYPVLKLHFIFRFQTARPLPAAPLATR